MLALGERSQLSVRSGAGSRRRWQPPPHEPRNSPGPRGPLRQGPGGDGAGGQQVPSGQRVWECRSHRPLPGEVLVLPLVAQVQAVPGGRPRGHPCHRHLWRDASRSSRPGPAVLARPPPAPHRAAPRSHLYHPVSKLKADANGCAQLPGDGADAPRGPPAQPRSTLYETSETPGSGAAHLSGGLPPWAPHR